MGRIEVNIRGEAFLMAGLWLLVLPMRWVLGAAGAALVHELGHLLALWATGEQVYEIEIGLFGARIETGPLEPTRELVCALAGPAAGLLLCLYWRVFPETAMAAAAQTAFNLMPIYPLDGGRAARAVRNICCK